MNIYFKIALCSLIGYLFGCIQTSYILGRYYKKIDIRKFGTHNAGASNATIVMGLKFGIVTVIVDILKGIAAVCIVKYFFNYIPHQTQILLYCTGISVVLGHIFPFFMKFRGGKGVAALIGSMLIIDIKFALIIIGILVIITVVTDYIALGSISMYAVLTILNGLKSYTSLVFYLCLLLFIISIIKHSENLKRIYSHTEKGLRAVLYRNH